MGLKFFLIKNLLFQLSFFENNEILRRCFRQLSYFWKQLTTGNKYASNLTDSNDSIYIK